jgi:hypothetical protein
VFLLLSYRLLLERPLGKFKPNTINHAQEVCLAQGCLLPEALPEDFALQTGAYGAPTPTFFTPTPAKTTSPSESSSANANQPGSIGGGGGDGEGRL